MNTLQYGTRDTIELLYSVPFRTREKALIAEKSLHKYYEAFKLRPSNGLGAPTEWFDDLILKGCESCKPVYEFIIELQAEGLGEFYA